MKLSHEDHDQLSVFTIAGDLIADQVDQVRKLASTKLDKSVRDFVLDLSGVEFVDSAGLETFVWLQERCGEQLGQVRLSGVQPNVLKILEMTRLAGRFDRHPDVETAIKSLR